MIVIYHGRCIDGFTAAWVARLRYGEDSATYVPAKYGDAPPDVTGEDVLIVDFSYPRATLEAMAASAKSLLVLDHHRTAAADLDGLPYAHFDMGRSGAGLTWDRLFADNVRPPLVSYVEDRDLWRFALPSSKEINAVIGATEQTWENWDELRCQVSAEIGATVRSGALLLRSVNRYVSEMSKQARTIDFEGHRVPIVNAPYLNVSELVGALAETAPFAIGWYQRGDGKYAYSLRSRGDFDVSELAKKYGGGGHKNAAGFVVAERVDT